MTIVRRVVVHGRVQGVRFRGWTVDAATGLGLAGWVRNRRDGSVEMLLAGEDDAVREMIERTQRGPSAARVDRVEILDSDEAAPATFAQRPTL